jgi:hypothetical protein
LAPRVSISESLQGLSYGAKALVVIVVLLWGLSEVLHVRRHRDDRRTIPRLQAAETGEERATIAAQRPAGVMRGAALSLGAVVPRGAGAGQHFVGAITNTGPLAAEDIQVTASLGANRAAIVSAPERLPPDSAAAAIDVMLPFGFLTAEDVLAALEAGELLRVRVTFTDGTPAPRAFEECFSFRREPNGEPAMGRGWVSRRVPCPG